MCHDSQNNYFSDQIGRVIMFVTRLTCDVCTCTSNSFNYLEKLLHSPFYFIKFHGIRKVKSSQREYHKMNFLLANHYHKAILFAKYDVMRTS